MVADFFFSPSVVTVLPGGTVEWTWAPGSAAHNITFNDGSPGRGNQTQGSFSRTFPTAGSFPYFCSNHEGMSGRVDVIGL